MAITLEALIQQVLDETFGPGMVPLTVMEPTGYVVHEFQYSQPRNYMEAIELCDLLADSIGYVLVVIPGKLVLRPHYPCEHCKSNEPDGWEPCERHGAPN